MSAANPSPAPVATPLLQDGNNLSLSWREFFRAAGDFIVAAFRSRVVGATTFSVVGQIVFIEHSGTAATVSGLPSARASYLTAKDGTAFSISGTSIIFPGPCKGWYFIDGGN
jgi:hypothetical protein